jgi:ABC-type antimicrobial peptide transport system permease subunit
VREDAQELGVLRSIGLTKRHVVAVSLFEALANLTCALLLGVVVGVIAVKMLSPMFGKVAEMPAQIIMPWKTLLAMVIFSFSTIVFGTILGTRQITSKNISQILRGL